MSASKVDYKRRVEDVIRAEAAQASVSTGADGEHTMVMAMSSSLELYEIGKIRNLIYWNEGPLVFDKKIDSIKQAFINQ
jgi:hypothetical protein